MREKVYKPYFLLVVAVILAFNDVDRWVLGLVQQDIQVDLSLSDTQLGFLSGIAFALFYAVMGLPIARWADRGNRAVIIGTTTALWSLAVMLCGLARNFTQLLLIRVGVAVGEAGCIPPAHSLIADTFERSERPRAMARYMMIGGPLGLVIGYFLGGWLNEFYGWRATFMLLGLPGAALGLLAWLTLREPRRGQLTSAALAELHSGALLPVIPTLSEVRAVLWANRTFRRLLMCVSLVYFFAAGLSQWQPAFFIRTYHMQTGELGTWFAVIYGIAGVLGTFGGGEWAARRAGNNESLQLRAIAAMYCGFGVIAPLVYLAPNKYWAFALTGVANLGVNMANGPLFATIQTLVPERMRATAIATIYMFANLIGLGLGPLAAGALSDWLRPLYGEDSLRYALLAMFPGYFWAAWLVWRASRSVMRDVQPTRSQQNEIASPEADGSSVPTESAHA